MMMMLMGGSPHQADQAQDRPSNVGSSGFPRLLSSSLQAFKLRTIQSQTFLYAPHGARSWMAGPSKTTDLSYVVLVRPAGKISVGPKEKNDLTMLNSTQQSSTSKTCFHLEL